MSRQPVEQTGISEKFEAEVAAFLLHHFRWRQRREEIPKPIRANGDIFAPESIRYAATTHIRLREPKEWHKLRDAVVNAAIAKLGVAVRDDLAIVTRFILAVEEWAARHPKPDEPALGNFAPRLIAEHVVDFSLMSILGKEIRDELFLQGLELLYVS